MTRRINTFGTLSGDIDRDNTLETKIWRLRETFALLSLSEYHYEFMCGLMYHIYSMCYNQLQSKLAFKEAMEDRAKDVVRKLLEVHSG